MGKGYPSDVNISQLTATRTPYRLYITHFDEIYNHSYPGEGTLDKPYIVGWLDRDPENPQTWSTMYKWLLTVFISLATLAVTFCSSAYIAEVQDLQKEFGTSILVSMLGMSLFLLGYGLGKFSFFIFGSSCVYFL